MGDRASHPNDPRSLGAWSSGWLWIGAYGGAAGFSVLKIGPVGEVAACISVQTWDSVAEIFSLRWDPARETVDLVAKIDVDTPWSLESSYTVDQLATDALNDAIDSHNPDPDRVFELLLDANGDLEIEPLDEDVALDLGVEEQLASCPRSDYRWAPRRNA